MIHVTFLATLFREKGIQDIFSFKLIEGSHLPGMKIQTDGFHVLIHKVKYESLIVRKKMEINRMGEGS